jgi:NAD(P)-dependent dehydrogenase (short-subunit alcohol dehydrogenase family)
MIDLSKKSILIFGATGGIGHAVVKYCHQVGGKIYASGRNKLKLKELQTEFPTIKTFSLDLSLDDLNTELLSTLPNFDGVVFANGKIEPFPVKYLKKRHVQSVFDTNFTSIVEVVAMLLGKKKLNEDCSVVFISSIAANHPYQGGAMYSASKAALTAYAKTLALELATKKIRANIVSPALVKTKMFDATSSAYDKKEFQDLISHYPLGVGSPEDVAGTICFLLSDLSKWMTGSEILMDGGLSLSSKK